MKKHTQHGDEHDAYVRREKPKPIDFGLFGAPDAATMPPDDDPTHGERSRLPIEYVDSPPAAPGTDTSGTSARAAAAIQSSGRYATSLALVHACVRSAGRRGATAQEIVDETAMLWPTVTSALRKLYLRGWIGWNEGHERASSASGLMQRVYVDEAFVDRWRTEQSRPPKPYARESARRASGT